MGVSLLLLFRASILQVPAESLDHASPDERKFDEAPTAREPSSLELATIQVERFLHDRVHAKYYRDRDGVIHSVTPEDAIWKWLRQEFSSADVRAPVLWVRESGPFLSLNASACSAQGFGRKPSFVKVAATFDSNGHKYPRTFESLWSSVTFELCNISMGGAFEHLFAKTAAGFVTEKDFVRQFATLEFNAARKRWKFYQSVWRPWAEENHFPSNPRHWQPSTAVSFDEWLASWPQAYVSEFLPTTYKKLLQASD